MKGVFDSERQSFACIAPYLVSTRFARYTFELFSIRLSFNYYREVHTALRHCYCQANMYPSDRDATFLVYNTPRSYRTCYTPKAEANTSLRFATFNSGTQFIITTIPTILSVSLSDQRNAFVEKNLVSNRTVYYYCPVPSDRTVFIQILQENVVFNTSVHTEVISDSSRLIHVQVGDFSQRTVGLTYSVDSDRTVAYLTFQQSELYTASVVTTFLNIASHRYCTIVSGATHSDRSVFFLTAPYSERSIGLCYTTGSDRWATFYIGRVWYIYTSIATPSKLVVSERLILTRGIIYLTERSCFCEMRPVWKKKSPLASSPLVNIRSNKDEKASIKIVNDRKLEIHGLNGEITEQVGLTEHRIVDQSKDNTLDVSATDNKGAAINSFGENVEKKLVKSYVFKIPINFT